MVEVDIDDLLVNGTVQFTFIKANGDERRVTATRNFKTIPAEHHPKSKPLAEGEVKKEKTEKQLANSSYFDLEALGWRSFKRTNLKEIHSFDPTI
jgi:hypothetical protein